MALATGGTAAPTPAHAQGAQTWLTINRSWLCRISVSSRTFTRRCTANWSVDSHGNVVAGDPNWVHVAPLADLTEVALTMPFDYPGTANVRAHYHAPPPPPPPPAPKAAPVRQSQSAAQPVVPVVSGPYGLWTPPPGHPAYSLGDFANDPNAAYYGTCTWYAEYRRPDEPLARLGNAAQWAWNATSHGLRVGSVPVVGATVVFQPGVLGASSGGHVGHVEAVYGGGWFLISEMNMSWNGGGFGRVSYRYALVMPGVSFVY